MMAIEVQSFPVFPSPADAPLAALGMAMLTFVPLAAAMLALVVRQERQPQKMEEKLPPWLRLKPRGGT